MAIRSNAPCADIQCHSREARRARAPALEPPLGSLRARVRPQSAGQACREGVGLETNGVRNPCTGHGHSLPSHFLVQPQLHLAGHVALVEGEIIVCDNGGQGRTQAAAAIQKRLVGAKVGSASHQRERSEPPSRPAGGCFVGGRMLLVLPSLRFEFVFVVKGGESIRHHGRIERRQCRRAGCDGRDEDTGAEPHAVSRVLRVAMRLLMSPVETSTRFENRNEMVPLSVVPTKRLPQSTRPHHDGSQLICN
eukprot:2581059-Prymnesium_polylepis.2